MPKLSAVPSDTPRISIVTPVLDRLAMLREAVESVRRQDVPVFEHIIVDGGSRDGTRDWVEAQPDLTYLPPPDSGVYDAMNKGIFAARGDVIGLLNSDDLYEPDALAAAVAGFAAHPRAAVVAGIARLVEGDRTIARFDRPLDLVPDARGALCGRCLPNPRFFRRVALEAVGPFDPSFGLVADRDLLLRIVEAGLVTVPLPQPVYVYRRHEGSLTFDATLKLSLRLRRELLALGRHWRDRPGASVAARHAGRELEGRQRAMLSLSALRSGRAGEALGYLAAEGGRPSARALGAVIEAISRAALRRDRP
jgi:glycosyltransferase involved in cell wall biosynthesis